MTSFRELFGRDPDGCWAAPGRVNLIGEHVDYNDGLVLPFALPFSTTSTVRTIGGADVVVRSSDIGEATFAVATAPGDVDEWAAYAAGVVWACRSHGMDVPGLEIAIESDVPIGAGLSSSAAICCSVAAAITTELGGDLDGTEIAAIARRAENDYVGAPTGVMDQLASMLGTDGHATLLDCRSLASRQVPLDVAAAGLALTLIDTKARHALVSSGYADRRRECERAAELLRVDALRDATEEQVMTLDDATLVRRAKHVVTEIARVNDVVALLDAGRIAAIGDAMSASHASLRDDFEVSCSELDVAVESALSEGALGARMTGGGFGGCVIALCPEGSHEAIADAVAGAYDKRGWDRPTAWEVTPSRGAHRTR
jgi:galactokinase